MYKFTTHSKHIIFLTIGFVVLIAIITTGVVLGASTFGPTAKAPDGNVNINCSSDKFLSGINTDCENPLVGIPPCEDGLLFNDSTIREIPVLRCYKFLDGNELDDGSGGKIIEELSCPKESPYLVNILWDSGTKTFARECVDDLDLIRRASQT